MKRRIIISSDEDEPEEKMPQMNELEEGEISSEESEVLPPIIFLEKVGEVKDPRPKFVEQDAVKKIRFEAMVARILAAES
jgi:hypothetical protein